MAGIVESKVDKRSTVIGTPHWMAPELFSATPSYGKEVDIWAFGSMVYEIATGYPPNVTQGIPFDQLGRYLKTHVPRLEGGNYSNELRDLVAFCLEELPSERPTIEQVQEHVYIANTSARYPMSSLSLLVRAFKQWELHGGSRKSLFMMGGAQGPSPDTGSIPDDEWNFSTTAAFDLQLMQRKSTAQDLYEAYGTNVELEGLLGGDTSRPSKQQKPSRRRPPPEALSRLPAAPLEKIFDPNTLSNYEDNSKQHYGRHMQSLSSTSSDLPLRADSSPSIRESMIDLGGHDSDTGLSNFPDMDTIKAGRGGRIRDESEDEYNGTLHDFSRPANSDPADANPNRRTQDWKFPSFGAPPASAGPEMFVFPAIHSEIQRPSITPGSAGGRPALVHHETEPVGMFGSSLAAPPPANERLSIRESLIDLDMGMIDMGDMDDGFAPPNMGLLAPEQDSGRPSTAVSEVDSESGENASGNPFEFEKHASVFQPREPSIYVSEDATTSFQFGVNSLKEAAEVSDFSASDAESGQNGQNETSRFRGASLSSDSEFMPPPPRPNPANRASRPSNHRFTRDDIPQIPPPPSASAMSGEATFDEMRGDMHRMIDGLTSQLDAFDDIYSSDQIARQTGSRLRNRGRSDSDAPNGSGSSTAK